MVKYPLKLSPAVKNTIWGGTHLKEMFNKEAPFDTLGETWELTCRPDGMSTILNGEYAGKTLEEYIKDNGTDVIKEGFDGDRFPLLIKFLDANDDLSIQVHPDDDYALKYENEFGKTEMWYILSSQPGAKIVYGLKDDISISDFEKATAEGKTEECLNYIEVKKGDLFFIPSGQVHALGKGIVVAEIQQNSNVTYRIYDYNRRQKDGSLRQLHLEQAYKSIKLLKDKEIKEKQYSRGKDSTNCLANCEYFKVDRYEVNGELNFKKDANSFTSILVLSGNGKICANNGKYTLVSGDSYFIPANYEDFKIEGKIEIIVSKIY